MGPMTTIDKDWFLKKIEDNGTSVRQLARHLDIDPSAASRMLSGQRRMKTEEANQIARFFNTSVHEVLAHAGVAVDLDGQPTNIILMATIDEEGRITGMREPRPLPQAVIDKAQSAVRGKNDRILAAMIRASNGPLAMWDDAVVLFAHSEAIENVAVAGMSIVKIRDGSQMFCRLERCRKTGEATIRMPDGDQEDILLLAATPVLAIIP